MADKLIDNGTLVTLGLVGVVAAVGVANKAGLYGSRSTGPTDAELRAVGRYTKSANPDEVEYAKEAGYGTSDLAIGKYVYSHYDEDSFAELLDHVREQGMVNTGKGSRALRGSPHAGPSVQRMMDFLKISKGDAIAVKARMDAGVPYQTLLEEADRLLNGHGVEYIQSQADTMRSQDGLSYVNMGDTYDTTLLYDHKTGRFSVGSWGDIVERQPRRFE